MEQFQRKLLLTLSIMGNNPMHPSLHILTKVADFIYSLYGKRKKLLYDFFSKSRLVDIGTYFQLKIDNNDHKITQNTLTSRSSILFIILQRSTILGKDTKYCSSCKVLNLFFYSIFLSTMYKIIFENLFLAPLPHPFTLSLYFLSYLSFSHEHEHEHEQRHRGWRSEGCGWLIGI